MPRQSKIRWSTADSARIAKEVRRFNSKLDREAAKHPETAPYMPPRLSVRKIKNEITARSELNRVYNSVERAFKKDSFQVITTENNVIVTKYQKKEIGIKVGIINQRRTRERKDADVSTQKGTMGTIKSNNLMPKKFDIGKIKSTREWDKFVNSVEKQSRARYSEDRMERYKQNYLAAIEKNLGVKGNKLYSLVKNLSAKFIYQNYYDDPVLQIQFTSDPIPAGVIADNAVEHWTAAIEQQNGGAGDE